MSRHGSIIRPEREKYDENKPTKKDEKKEKIKKGAKGQNKSTVS